MCVFKLLNSLDGRSSDRLVSSILELLYDTVVCGMLCCGLSKQSTRFFRITDCFFQIIIWLLGCKFHDMISVCKLNLQLHYIRIWNHFSCWHQTLNIANLHWLEYFLFSIYTLFVIHFSFSKSSKSVYIPQNTDSIM